jgi:hypothetical protein
MKATAEDFELIRELRTSGVFRDFSGELIPSEKGTIVIPCADGDRITDILTHHWGACNGHPCHHSLSLNGGPLLIPECSPLSQEDGEGKILLKHSFGAHQLKALTTVVLYGHWPCGAAISANMTLNEALDLCIKSKDTVRTFLQKKDVAPTVVLCFHVDYGNGLKRSYFFDRKAWNERGVKRLETTVA